MSSSTQSASERGAPAYTPTESQYLAVQETPEFQELRRRYRGWVLPVAAAALAWYFLYVLLAAYATDFMAKKLVGNINVALVMGLLQFASTFGVTALYIRHADRVLDPVSERIRDAFEAGR
ncbi:MAG: rane protein [Frankiales bacterium]|nr:rane protein [Frankiales bacterium]